MTQEEFTAKHQERWKNLEAMLKQADRLDRKRLVNLSDVVDLTEFDREYRRICMHLALSLLSLIASSPFSLQVCCEVSPSPSPSPPHLPHALDF